MYVLLLILFLVIEIAGLIGNLYPIYFFNRISKKRNPFSFLVTSFSVGNCLVLGVNLIAVPSSYLHLTLNTNLNAAFGTTALIGWFAAVGTHLIISVNRCMAIILPGSYKHIFTKRQTLLIILITWSLAICATIPFSIPTHCSFTLINGTWTYLKTPFCSIAAFYGDFIFMISICTLIVVLDVILIIWLIKRNKKSYPHVSLRNRAIHIIRENNIEIRLIIQTMSTSFYLVFLAICFHILPLILADDENIHFVCATCSWMLYHSMDGYYLYWGITSRGAYQDSNFSKPPTSTFPSNHGARSYCSKSKQGTQTSRSRTFSLAGKSITAAYRSVSAMPKTGSTSKSKSKSSH
uniref:G_PROTEIN_RECEP_F1_2 domain-containing protein n=1 Tax=Rhabditophanes sp. KR3021 TaxID=114890 RepID=A0AC35TG34_9BILA